MASVAWRLGRWGEGSSLPAFCFTLFQLLYGRSLLYQNSSQQLNLVTYPTCLLLCVCPCDSVCASYYCGDGTGFWCWGFKLTLTCLFPSVLTHATPLCLSDLAVFKERLRMLTVGGMKIMSLSPFLSRGLHLNKMQLFLACDLGKVDTSSVSVLKFFFWNTFFPSFSY